MIKKMKMDGSLCEKTMPCMNIHGKSVIFVPNEKHQFYIINYGN